MRNRLVGKVVMVTLILAVFCTIVTAQVPTGEVNGIVTDPHDAVVANAHVIAVSKSQGISRETSTNSDGLYVFPNLPAGNYDLKIDASGFAPLEFKGVVVQVGRATTLDAKLQVAGVGTTINVSEGAGEIELTQSMIQGEITSATIQSIPLNGRNFLELAYLIPGNRPAPNFDPTKTNTLEVSSAGGFGRGGNITVDGGDNNDEVVGGTLANFPQDSIQEFQIATGRFTSEVGRSGNSIINVVTKSGGNDLHGSAFFYERDRYLQGLPATFDRSLATPPFHREQFGGSAGGPIARDKAWWFGSVEYRYQDASIQTGTRDFTSDQIINTSASAPLRDLLISTRLDDQLTARNSLMVRYSFNRSTDVAPASLSQPSPLITAAERQDSLNRFHSIAAGLTTTISPTKANNFSFHFDNFFNNLPAFTQNAPTTNPAGLASTNELLFPELADGANFNLPQATYLDRVQLRDAYSWTLGKHALKLGGELQHYTAHGIINVFGTGTIILVSNFGSDIGDLNGDGVVDDRDIPIAVALKSSAPVSPVPIPHLGNNYLAGYAQDDWRIRPNLTLNLGLRWEYDTDLLGNDSSHGPCPNLTSLPAQPCVWLANVIDLRHNTDKKSFGPRVGFAYDPFGKGKTVLRGGYGIYYDRIILEAPSLERVQDNRALTVTPFAGSSCTFPGDPNPPDLGTCFAFGHIPGVGFAPGSPTLANPFSGPHQTGGVGLIVLSPDSHHPVFQQFSLGLQQQLGSNWLVSADGLHVFGNKQLIGQLLRNTTSTSPDVACPGNNVPCVVTDPLTGISDNVTVLGSFAKSWYDGLIVSVQHKPTKIGRFSYLYNINYTYSKTLDYSDDDQLTNSNADEQVNLIEGTSGLAKEKGYASSDERHRLTLFGQLQMPWDFSFSPIYTFGSGVPADTLVPALNSRLPILSRNAVGREIKNSDQLNAVITQWNALPACPAPAPCHAGPALPLVPGGINFFSPFSSLDFRLTKDIHLGERMRLSLIGEAFNIFNFTNVRGFSKNSYSGRSIAIGPDFYAAQSVAGGFFGSGGPRAFQFAARFNF